MSRIGNLPIDIPSKVKVEVKDRKVLVEGPKGKLDFDLPRRTSAMVEGARIKVQRDGDDAEARALHGLSRAILNNMVKGVNDGYSKQLLVEGVGFRAAVQGTALNLSIGFSHPVVYQIPKGIKIAVADTQDKKPQITIEGADKQLVGEVAACVRRFYKPEPYKGKGIRYVGEQVRRKAGKTVTTAGG